MITTAEDRLQQSHFLYMACQSMDGKVKNERMKIEKKRKEEMGLPITHPSAEAYEEIVGVLKNEGGSGLLGECGLEHDQNPNGSGEGDEEDWKEEAAMTEEVSLEEEEGAHEKHRRVGNSDNQAPPSEVSASQTHTRSSSRYLLPPLLK